MARSKFALFSTELGASLDPQEAFNPAPSVLIVFDTDPIGKGTYDPFAGNTMRGSVIPTLGGVVVQDFGEQIQDQRITISDEAAFSILTNQAFIAASQISNGQFYFTDGYDCFLVKFARPRGYISRRNLISSHYGMTRFNYEMNFVVLEREDLGEY
jgi:hypothetical protein